MGTTSPVSGQSVELFHVVSDEAVRGSAADRLLSVRQDEATLKADAVSFPTNAKEILKRPQFEINLPYMGKPIAFQTLGYWAKSDSLFLWQGKTDGKPALFVLNGSELSGGFSTNSRSFDVFTAGQGQSIVQLLDPDRREEKDAILSQISEYGVAFGAGINDSIQKSGSSGSGQIDVLFVYSSLLTDPGVDALLAVGQTNTAINESEGASGSVHYLGAVQDPEMPDNTTSVDVLNYLSTNSAIADLRNAYGADVVAAILSDITNENGAVIDIKPPSNLAFLVSDMASLRRKDTYTFAHEMGHIVGGRHDTDTTTVPFPYGHGYHTLTPDQWGSLLNVEAPADRDLRWSSPLGTFGGGEYPTGTVSFNDVARVWAESSGDIASYRSPVTPPSGDLTVEIDGPGTMLHKEECTFHADAFFDNGLNEPCTNCTYSWFEKPTWSSSWTNMSVFTPSILFTLFDNPGTDLRVDVSSSTQTASTSVTILESSTAGCSSPPGAKNATIDEPDVSLTEGRNTLDIYPNPSSHQFVIRYDIGKPSRVHLAVFDVLGREVDELYDAVLAPGVHEISWHPVNVSPGLYIIRATFDDGTSIVKPVSVLE